MTGCMSIAGLGLRPSSAVVIRELIQFVADGSSSILLEEALIFAVTEDLANFVY
jgi:hypothetical protein